MGLVLTRKVGETVVIDTGDHKIEVTFIQAKGRQIRLHFNAPKHFNIARSEWFSRRLKSTGTESIT